MSKTTVFKFFLTIHLTLLLSFVVSVAMFGQYKSKYPDIHIIDMHIHASTAAEVTRFFEVSDIVKQKYGYNLASFVSLHPLEDPENTIFAAAKNRMFFALRCEMRPHKGLLCPPEEVVAKVRNGYVGYKFWFGDPHRVTPDEGKELITRIDDPKFENFFATLERENVLMASLHIADPNGPFGDRQSWMKDPVYYWEQIRAFENVVAKYPNLTIIAAHCAWLICQDAQLDYLRYMLSTYPNLHVDVSAIFQYLYLLNTENLRDFFNEYQDRILFGSDVLGLMENTNLESVAERYAVYLSILETDRMIDGKFSTKRLIQGLNLPREVLEKMYYKNTLKLYPALKEAMGM